MDGGEGQRPPIEEVQIAQNTRSENPNAIPFPIHVRKPVFDYWMGSLGETVRNGAAGLSDEQVRFYENSPLAQLYNRLQQSGVEQGDAEKVSVELSRDELKELLKTREDHRFSAVEMHLQREMERELKDAFPARSPKEIARKLFRRF